jgi:hypothetical protein
MFAFPFIWQDVSDQAIEDYYRAEMGFEGVEGFDDGIDLLMDFVNVYGDTYSTGEQQALGGLAFLAALIGLGAEFLLRPERSTMA